MQPFDPKSLTAAQIRAARALIGMTAEELAKHASLGVATVRRAEAGSGIVAMTTSNAQRIVEALTAAGVVLIPRGDGGEGVRLTK